MHHSYRSTPNNKRSFTLVELIVVLVILAVLAGMLVPALTGYIKKARKEKYITNAHYALEAAQAVMQERYAFASEDVTSHLTTDGNNVRWHSGSESAWGTKVLELMGRGRGADNGEPFIFVFGVGSNDPKAGMDLIQQHTVYYIAYLENENARTVFYVNGQWMYEYPRWDDSKAIKTKKINGKDFRNTIVLDGALIPLQFYIVSNRTNLADDKFWTTDDPASLLSHSDGFYGKK